MPNILQVGTYCSSNKGDAAMEFSLARALIAHRDDIAVTISTPFPQLDEDAYHPIPVVRCYRRRLIWASVLLIRAWLWQQLSRRLGTGFDFLVNNPELTAIRNADLVVDLSGDMLTEDYGPHVAYSHFLPILTALAMQRPVMLCAQSIGPFKLTRGLARFILKRVSLITVREAISFEYLQELGIPQENVIQTADLAFMLEPAADQTVNEIATKEGLETTELPLLGVSLSNLVSTHYKKRNTMAPESGFYDVMAATLDEIAKQHKLQVVFIPHVTGPRPASDDRILAMELQQRMESPAIVIQGDYTPDILKGLIRRCSFYFGARMHANIAALSSGIPTLAIAYSHKTAGIMQLLGQNDYVCDIGSLNATELPSLFSRLVNNQTSIRDTLTERARTLRTDAFRNIECIDRLLDA